MQEKKNVLLPKSSVSVVGKEEAQRIGSQWKDNSFFSFIKHLIIYNIFNIFIIIFAF